MENEGNNHPNIPPKGRWSIGPALQSYLQALKTAGHDGVESRLSEIREETFERMRSHINNSLSWQTILHRVSRNTQATEAQNLTLESVQSESIDENMLVAMRSVGVPTEASVVWNGDWQNTQIHLRFIPGGSSDQVSPLLTFSLIVEDLPSDFENTTVQLRIPNIGLVPIQIDSRECIHEECPVIDPANVINESRLELVTEENLSIPLMRQGDGN